ncbi:MAG: lysophospholipid acyltransferase family protein [Rhodospirillaceae bacterium]|nr:lysophospholipid acyltransferase family protein [Rhodospirillaceae bacterium]
MGLRNRIKHWSRAPWVRRALGGLTTGLIRVVKTSTRWSTINAAAAEPAWRGDKPVIVAFWHNRLALMPYCWPSKAPFHMLISGHTDGQLIARAVGVFGISTIAGSSTRGGGAAMRELIRKLKAGESVGITPDGPRGPVQIAQDGVVALARLSGAAILPAAVSVSPRKRLNTWDRLIIGLPFGAGAMVWGEPIHVPRDCDDATAETLRQRVEAELNRVSHEADAAADKGRARGHIRAAA